MKTRTIRWLLILLTFTFPACARGVAKQETEKTAPGGKEVKTEKYLLRFHFKKGDVLRWNVLHTLKIRTSIKAVSETVETVSRSTKVWTALDVAENGNTTFEYKVDDVDMKRYKTIGKDNDKEDKYNSRTDKTIPIAFQNIEGTVGVPLAHLMIDPLGILVKKIALTDYSGSSQENRIVVPLPKEPVSVGESWYVDTPIELKQAGGTVEKIRARQKYTLSSVRSGLAKIEMITQILSVVTPMQESQIIDRYSKGSFELDLDAGHLVSQQTAVEKTVVGVPGQSDSFYHQSLFKECCCGRNACEICSP